LKNQSSHASILAKKLHIQGFKSSEPFDKILTTVGILDSKSSTELKKSILGHSSA